MASKDRIRWNERYKRPDREYIDKPRQLLVNHANLLPIQGLAIELAIGQGQNIQFLRDHNLQVIGVDISLVALKHAKQSQPDLMAFVADLNHLELPSNHFDVVLNFYYLQRDYWSEFARILKPGGVLFYETLMQDIREVRKDIAPEYLLNPNELQAAFSNWEILYHFEGWTASKHGKQKAIASMIVHKPNL